ncbi:hypothetical protein KAR91_39560 [Candidatus Pacearchaeota archaeon]|nr:hypothetical protein [Candidatus Pacearchaeota archaeon]
MEKQTIQAIHRDIRIAQAVRGNQNVLWPRTLEWMRIKNFKLQPYYNRACTDLLVVIPPHYGLINAPLEEFYMAKGLKVHTKKGWLDIPHYHTGFYNKLTKKEWSWFCVHPQNWKRTDSILTFFKLVEILLQNPFQERIK